MKLYKNNDNKIFAFEKDGSQDHLITKDLERITKTQADKIIKEKQDEKFVQLPYGSKRLSRMRPVGDQLDAIWKQIAFMKENGIEIHPEADEIISEILDAKQEFPKR